MKPLLEVKGLWKQYKRNAKREAVNSLAEEISHIFKPRSRREYFWALKDINFSLNAGDSLAIIGHNGAGKSTLLKILSRITPPTRGEIVLRGRLSSLLEVGTGFHSELTGRENIYLNGSILGLSRADINKKFDEIIDFSGVEVFLDTPLKHYSSGMQLRLAFSVAAHLEPDILVIDEVLAVGDSAFQQKCIDKMTEVSQSGKTIIFVAHNMNAVKKLCKRGLLLENGVVVFGDSSQNTVDFYQQRYLGEGDFKNFLVCQNLRRNPCKREIEISSISLSRNKISPKDSLSITLELKENVQTEFNDVVVGMHIRTIDGMRIYHFSNVFLAESILYYKSGTRFRFVIPETRLAPGVYLTGFFLEANKEVQDWIPDGIKIKIEDGNAYERASARKIKGVVQPPFIFEII